MICPGTKYCTTRLISKPRSHRSVCALRCGLPADPRTGQGHGTAGLYVAGELAGGLFYHNYAGGSGLMAGSVFGRLAGEQAALAALGAAAWG